MNSYNFDNLSSIYRYLVRGYQPQNTWATRTSEEYAQKRRLTEFCAIWAGEISIHFEIEDEFGFKHPLHHRYIEQVDYLLSKSEDNSELARFLDNLIERYPLRLNHPEIYDEEDEISLMKILFPNIEEKKLVMFSAYIKAFNGY